MKVGFFSAWEAIWGKILKIDQLNRRGWSMLNRYYMCQGDEESNDHSPPVCKSKIVVAASFFFVLCVMGYLLPVREDLLSLHGSFVGKKRRKAWKATPLYLFWTPGKERNRRLFVNTVQLNQTTKIFLYDYFVWNGFHQSIFMIGFVNWLNLK